MLHPHTQRFGAPVSGTRKLAPSGPQTESSKAVGRRARGLGDIGLFGGGTGMATAVEPNTLQDKRDRRKNIWDQMCEIVQAAEGEQRELSAEEASKYDALEKDLDTLGNEIREVEESQGRRQRHAQRDEEFGRVERQHPVTDEGDDAPAEEYALAFRAFLRDGMNGIAPEQRQLLMRAGFQNIDGKELRAAGVATGAAGGYLVPQGFRARIQEAMKFYSQMRQVAEVIDTDTGNPLPWPTNDDTANVGAILAENTQVTEQDITIGTKQLGAFMYTSKLIRVSLQLLQDSAFDIEAFLARKLGQRIGRIQNQHFTTGVGTTQPEGIQTNATVGVTGATGETTSVTYNDLVDLTHSVDIAYRSNAGFMLNDLTIGSVRKLTDSQNRPLWQPSLQAGEPDTLLGYGLFVNNDMPVMAANAKSILFGDFNLGYVIRDVTGVQLLRLEERYADFLQVGFLAFQRSDGLPQDPAAIRAFKNSAT